MRFLENKENKNQDSQSIHLTNSKYNARSPKMSDSQSIMTGKKVNTQRGMFMNISDQKGILNNSDLKQVVQNNQVRKTVVFK
jgi:hypothetical protein